MQFKRISTMLLVCVIMTSVLSPYAGAIEIEDAYTSTMIQRASGRFSMDVSGNTLLPANQSFPLEAGEEVTITASYSPRSASVDFGIIAPNGLFYSVNGTNGSVNYTFEVDQRGSYTLAVRNNSSQTVSVSGYVNY